MFRLAENIRSTRNRIFRFALFFLFPTLVLLLSLLKQQPLPYPLLISTVLMFSLGIAIYEFFRSLNHRSEFHHLSLTSFEHWHRLAKTLNFESHRYHFGFLYSTHIKGYLSHLFTTSVHKFPSGIWISGGQEIDEENVGSVICINLNDKKLPLKTAVAKFYQCFGEVHVKVCSHQLFPHFDPEKYDFFEVKIDQFGFFANPLMRLSGHISPRPTSEPDHVYFIANKTDRSLCLEVSTYSTQSLLLGPMESNTSPKKRLMWYQTLRPL